MNLRGHVVPAADVTTHQREDMFLLLQDYYENVCRDVFEADLAEKQWVILLTDEARRVRGFSTQMVFDVTCRGRSVTALFSGDTIVDRRLWGRNPLSRIWGRFALDLIDRFPRGKLYWFLISKGYKTYRFLPVFFREFLPDYRREASLHEIELLIAFARKKFPDAFDEETGVIRAQAGQCRLAPGVADITAARRADPHVAFFESRNPGHWQGDELCCLAPLDRQNFTPAAYRVIGY